MLSYTVPKATVQQVLQKHPRGSENGNNQVRNVLHRLRVCRTAALGYHVYRCNEAACGHIKYQYHSCRDRHCPQCGAIKKEEWMEARKEEILPVKYYHVVFTLPHELNALVMGHRAILYKALFDASAKTLLSFASDPGYLGATPGIISVLHTWGQQLSFHPHIHCIVSGGGITGANNWKEAVKNDWCFLFPVKAMAIVYRAKFLETLKTLVLNKIVQPKPGTDIGALIDHLYKKDWVVYAKAPFGGPMAVIEYLGRYTHKVAISNHRIMSVDEREDTVTFSYKDYNDGSKQKQMTLAGGEFIRRFEQHILPKRFTRIRTYGYLSNRGRRQRINEVLGKMRLPRHKGFVRIPLNAYMIGRYGIDISECPCCKGKTMQLIRISYPWKGVDDS